MDDEEGETLELDGQLGGEVCAGALDVDVSLNGLDWG